jgi:hypothetical protein
MTLEQEILNQQQTVTSTGMRMLCPTCYNFEDECGARHINGYLICGLTLKREEEPQPLVSTAAITKLCLGCRRVAVEGIKRYCGKCAHKRKLVANNRSRRARQGLKGGKPKIRPFRLRHLRMLICAMAILTLKPPKRGQFFLQALHPQN